MKTIALSVSVSASLGEISAEIIEAENPCCIMVLAHGAGAGMHHAFMKDLSVELARSGVSTMRYNLHYMEHGKKRPDAPAIAHKVIEQVILKAVELYPALPLIVAGKSFGGRMTSQLMARLEIPQVKGIVFYGFPLHPAGSPGIERASHLQEVKVPMLFLQGSKDSLADMSLVTEVVKGLTQASLEVIENADHSFKIGKKDSIVDLSKKTKDWFIDKKII